jgi:hypothetical protein
MNNAANTAAQAVFQRGGCLFFLRPVEKLAGNSRILIPHRQHLHICGAPPSLHMIALATADKLPVRQTPGSSPPEGPERSS